MQGGQLDPPIEHRAFSGRPEACQAAFVGLTVGKRDDRLGEESTEHLLLRPAEQSLRLRVPTRDQALEVDRDDGIQRMGNEQTEALLALAQRVWGLPPLVERFPH